MHRQSYPFLVSAFLATAPPLLAKRGAPAPVPAVRRAGIEYSVPHDPLPGMVQATDLRTSMVLWNRQVYTVRFDPALETDAQDCYITGLDLASGHLRVTNERGCVYLLSLDSLQVRVVRGHLVLDNRER
jgi:hypothetical protein